MSAIRDADRIIGLLESKEGVEKYRLLVNRVRPKLIKSNDMMGVDDVVEILSCDLLGVIPEDTNIITSTNKGEPVVNDEKSLAGIGVRNLNACIASPSKEDAHLNDDSCRFHEAMGYSLVGRFHNSGYKFGCWYDMIWMEKIIDSSEEPTEVKFGEWDI